MLGWKRVPRWTEGRRDSDFCEDRQRCRCFDSLTHVRPYKSAWTEDEALDEIERLAGTKFDPAVAEAFLRLHGRASSARSEPTLRKESGAMSAGDVLARIALLLGLGVR